jgi:hypothetical protein
MIGCIETMRHKGEAREHKCGIALPPGVFGELRLIQ